MKTIKAMLITIILMVTFTSLQAQVEIIYPDHPDNAVRNFIPAETQHASGTPHDYIISRQNAAGAGNFWLNTFGGESYHIQGVWELPEGFDSNIPGYYTMSPTYTLPENVINPFDFQMIRWIVILNPDRSKPINNNPLTIQGTSAPTVKVPVGYPLDELKKDLANMQILASTIVGWNQYKINLADVTWPDLTVDGSHVIIGKWQQLFNHVPLLPGMDELAPTFLLEVSTGIQLLNINTASFDELQTIKGVGPTLAERIIAARPFTDMNDMIQKVSGIGRNNGAKIDAQIKYE